MPLGLSVADFPRKISPRQLVAWLNSLGPTSATFQSVNGAEELPFNAAEARMADVADLLQLLIWVTRRAHFKGSPAVPKPLPRPGVRKQLPAGDTRLGSGPRTLEEIDAFLVEIDRLDRLGLRQLTSGEVVT